MKFLKDFEEYCYPMTGSPAVFVRWTALLMLSVVAGRKHYIRRADNRRCPNLWILILGLSSSYKSEPLRYASNLLYRVCSDAIGAQIFSFEKFLEDMDKNPHQVFIYDEASTAFHNFASPYNQGLKAAWLTLYSGTPFKKIIKGATHMGETAFVENAYLCFGGASTPSQINEQLNGSTNDLLSGFFQRFTLVSYFGEERTVVRQPPADDARKQALIDKLQTLWDSPENEYVYSLEADALFQEWHGDIDKRMKLSEERLHSYYKKQRDEQFDRIAILSAFERGSRTIEVHDVENAIELLYPIEKSWPLILTKFTEKEWARDRERIIAFMKLNGDSTRREISRKLHIEGGHLTAHLTGLKADDIINYLPKKSKSGRDIEFVHLLED